MYTSSCLFLFCAYSKRLPATAIWSEKRRGEKKKRHKLPQLLSIKIFFPRLQNRLPFLPDPSKLHSWGKHFRRYWLKNFRCNHYLKPFESWETVFWQHDKEEGNGLSMVCLCQVTCLWTLTEIYVAVLISERRLVCLKSCCQMLNSAMLNLLMPSPTWNRGIHLGGRARLILLVSASSQLEGSVKSSNY